jgi:hypothetical protein
MRSRLLCVGLAAAALATGAASASADVVVPAGSGVTEPGGVARTPDGALWIADGVNGICRVGDAGLVTSDYCQLEHAGPSAVFDLAFDQTSSSFYVAEGSSQSGGVWRMHWNAGTQAIDGATKIANAVAEDRVFGLDVTRVPVGLSGSSLEVDFVTKRSRLVNRILNADTASPTTIAVGTATAEDVADVARLNDALYLAEGTGVTKVANPGSTDRDAVPVPELAGHIAGALAADPATNRLYVGTDDGTGADQILAFEPGQPVESYASGLAGVSALNIDTAAGTAGAVLAGDDPAVASGAVGADGGGRILSFAPVPLGRANVQLDTATLPRPVITDESVTLRWSSSVADATFDCKIDGEDWVLGCGTERTFWGAGGAPLAEGAHTIAIRANSDLGEGQTVRHVFVVDRTAPQVTIDNDRSAAVVGGSLDLNFTASEGGVSYSCSLDGGAFEPCDSPHRLRGLALGEHTVVVKATDLVGHKSDPADPAARWTFDVVAPPPVPPAPPAQQPSQEAPRPDGSGPGPREDRRPVLVTVASRSCRLTVTRRLDMRKPPAVIRVGFPTGSRPGWVRMAIEKRGRRGTWKRIASMHRIVESSGACARVSWGLWRSEGRKLRNGTYRLTVSAGKTRRSLKKAWRGSLRVKR